ncbi:MAG: hypothetical protein KAU14_07635 [Thermoplasmata archaeon]|nr:hypothetical protein [Thermoplasmata archaeon]
MTSREKITIGFLILVAGIVLLALTTKETSATTITVDDDGPADYAKTQYAIDNAIEGDMQWTM